MIEFVDKTESSSGTRIDRAHMMAIQGFLGNTIEFLNDVTIVETNSEGHKKTIIVNNDGSITEKFDGIKTITKKIFFNDGIISEVIV